MGNKRKLPVLAIFIFILLSVSAGVHSQSAFSRVIVVDKNLVIQKILNSNTEANAEPIVYLEQVGGVELPYTDSIEKQYRKLGKKLDSKKTGIIYQKASANRISVMDFFALLFKKIFGL